MPTVIREFARASAGEVGGIAAGVFSSGELVTAVRNGSDNLELIVWDPDATNRALTRGADSGTQAGEVGEIALAMMGRRCLTAVQNANGYLLVIPWALESDGTLSRLEVADHQAGKASYLAIAPLSETLAVMARSLLGNPDRLDQGPMSEMGHALAESPVYSGYCCKSLFASANTVFPAVRAAIE